MAFQTYFHHLDLGAAAPILIVSDAQPVRSHRPGTGFACNSRDIFLLVPEGACRKDPPFQVSVKQTFFTQICRLFFYQILNPQPQGIQPDKALGIFLGVDIIVFKCGKILPVQ